MKLGYNTAFAYPDATPQCVLSALRDLRRDFDRVFEEPAGEGTIQFRITPSLDPETFSIRIDHGQLCVEGGDSLGLIYGIYSVSEEWLGIPALWYWMDHQPERRPCVVIPDDFRFQSHKPVFKYRGWFLNDEDLLSHWGADPFSGISYEAYQRVFEALLRSRGNMIVPGTSVFADEPCWKWAAERGLMLAEHHQDNLGLNPFRWPPHVPYNYLTHPEYLEHAWKQAVRAKASHGTRVIWSLAHRGKADCPLWQEIPALKDNPAQLGQLLENIMNRQLEIIREVDPDPECIVNTWMEIAELMDQGFLKLPEDAHAVWADFHGGTATVIEPGKPASGDGVYYHVAMHGKEKAHLTEWISIRRIQEEFLRYQRAGATHYVLINVSNLRPFFISASLATRWLYDGIDETDKDAPIHRFFERDMGLPGEETLGWHETLTLASRSFGRMPGCFVGDEGPTTLASRVINAILLAEKYPLDRIIADIRGTLLQPITPDSQAIRHGDEFLKEISETVRRYEEALRKADSLGGKVAPRFEASYEYGIAFQTRYLLVLWQLVEKAVAAKMSQEEGNREKTINLLEEALVLAERQYELLQNASTGKWLGFYACGIISPVLLPSQRIRWALEVLRGYMAVPSDEKLPTDSYRVYHACKSYHGDRHEDVGL